MSMLEGVLIVVVMLLVVVNGDFFLICNGSIGEISDDDNRDCIDVWINVD